MLQVVVAYNHTMQARVEGAIGYVKQRNQGYDGPPAHAASICRDSRYCRDLCLVLVCGGMYGLGGGFFSSFWDRIWAE
jgi:hypothetical protein